MGNRVFPGWEAMVWGVWTPNFTIWGVPDPDFWDLGGSGPRFGGVGPRFGGVGTQTGGWGDDVETSL